MAKIKLGKVLTAIAAIGGVVAGGIILYKKYMSAQETLDDDFEDFEDDFDDEDLDFEEEEVSAPPKREYVPINLENGQKAADLDLKEDSEVLNESGEDIDIEKKSEEDADLEDNSDTEKSHKEEIV